MNTSLSSDSFDESASKTEEHFIRLLKSWLSDFHGSIAPLTDEQLTKRLQSYLWQEELYLEKVDFFLTLLPFRPRCGLDIGSSAGGLSVAFAMRGIHMQGIEPSQPGVEASILRAQRRGLENVHFQQGVGENLPFPDKTFDFVISLAVLEHVQNVADVVRETYRVLKPGGWAYFEVPNNLFPFEAHYKMVWLPMMPKSIAKHYVRLRGANPGFLDQINYMNRWIVMRHFRKAGFTNLRDLYAEFLAGKVSGASWAKRTTSLVGKRWSAFLIRLLFGTLPTAWFVNRAVFLLARKPDA